MGGAKLQPSQGSVSGSTGTNCSSNESQPQQQQQQQQTSQQEISAQSQGLIQLLRLYQGTRQPQTHWNHDQQQEQQNHQRSDLDNNDLLSIINQCQKYAV